MNKFLLNSVLIIAIFIIGGLGFTTESQAFSVVPPGPVIGSTGYLQTGVINQAYLQFINVSGGVSPYKWIVATGSLPPGLILESTTGVLSGVPNALGVFNFTIQATDGNSEIATQNFTVTIAPQSLTGFVYTRTPTGDTIVGNTITVRIQGVFGVDFCTDPRVTNYSLSYYAYLYGQQNSDFMQHAQGDVVDDTIPFDLFYTLYSPTGTVLRCNSGSTQYGYISPLDSGFDVQSIVIITSGLVDGTVGIQYNNFVQETNGTTPLSWNVLSGLLPDGLSLDANTGEISGIPTTIGTSNFTVQVVDANDNTATKDLSITVHGNTLVGNPVVGPLSGVTLTFIGGVTQEGQTTVITSGTGQPPPTGFKLGTPPTYYSVSTTALFDPQVEVCITWQEGQFNNENNLKLWHFDGIVWTDVTESGYPDTVNNVICGLTDSFSNFAIFEKKQVVTTIDIKPGTYPNTINLGSNGTVAVAILSTLTFDATTIDPLTITLASAPVQLRGNGTAMYSFQDVNNDGLLDIIVHVSTEALQLSSTDTLANLVGYTSDSTEVLGSDTVRIVP